MKKGLLLMLLLFLIGSNLAFCDLTLMCDFGVDLSSMHKVATKHYETDPGMAIGLEFYFLDIEEVDFGIGISSNTVEVYGPAGDWSSLNFSPFFFSMHVQLMEDAIAVPFINARVGFNFLFNGDDLYESGGSTAGGMYYSYAFGAMFPGIGSGAGLDDMLSLKIEIRYTHLEGKLNNSALVGDGRVGHTQWTFGVGMGFKF